MSSASGDSSARKDIERRALGEMLRNMPLRLTEMMGLEKTAFSYEKRRLRIDCARHRAVWVPLTESCASALRELQQIRSGALLFSVLRQSIVEEGQP